MTLTPEAWVRIRTALEVRVADLRALACAPALTGSQRELLRSLADRLTLDVADLARVLGAGK